MIEKRDVPLSPTGGYKPDVMLPSGTLHQLPTVHAIPQPLSLREVLSVFRRQWLPMTLIVLTSLAIGLYVIFTSTKIYRVTTSMLVENDRDGGNQVDPVSAAAMPSPQRALADQVEILQSFKLRSEVYNLANIQPGSDNSVEDMVLRYPSISVETVGESSVLRINVESSIPEYAERVAQFMPEVYSTYLKTSRQGEVKTTEKNLNERLVQLNRELKAAQQKLLAYKVARNLLPYEGEGNVRSSQSAQTRAVVKQAEADLAASKKRIDELKAKKRSVPAELVTPAKVSNASAIEAQKNKIADLKASRSSLLQRYHPEHPDVVALDSQIRAAEEYLKAIPAEVDSTTRSKHPFIIDFEKQIQEAEAEYEGAKSRLAQLRQWASQSEEEFRAYNQIAPEQGQLEQEVEDKKAAIEWITRRIDDLTVRTDSARDPVVVLQPAGRASIVRPQPVQYTALALLFGLFLAVAFALLKDNLDDRLASPDEVFRLTGLPVVGEVFPLPSRSRHLGAPNLPSRFVERYRVLRFNLSLLMAKHPSKSIVVTGSGRHEGKTEVALNLAYATAEGEGRRVILVDADLRWPSLHRVLNLPEKPGLADVLMDRATLEEALHAGPVPGLQILTSGGTTANPVDLLSLPRMVELLAEMEGRCDLVLFDSPASTGLADAHVLARVVDSVVYVAKTGRTRRSNLRKGVDAFRQASVKVLGVIEVAENTRR